MCLSACLNCFRKQPDSTTPLLQGSRRGDAPLRYGDDSTTSRPEPHKDDLRMHLGPTHLRAIDSTTSRPDPHKDDLRMPLGVATHLRAIIIQILDIDKGMTPPLETKTRKMPPLCNYEKEQQKTIFNLIKGIKPDLDTDAKLSTFISDLFLKGICKDAPYKIGTSRTYLKDTLTQQIKTLTSAPVNGDFVSSVSAERKVADLAQARRQRNTYFPDGTSYDRVFVKQLLWGPKLPGKPTDYNNSTITFELAMYTNLENTRSFLKARLVRYSLEGQAYHKPLDVDFTDNAHAQKLYDLL